MCISFGVALIIWAGMLLLAGFAFSNELNCLGVAAMTCSTSMLAIAGALIWFLILPLFSRLFLGPRLEPRLLRHRRGRDWLLVGVIALLINLGVIMLLAGRI